MVTSFRMSDMHVVAWSLYSCGSVCVCHVATHSVAMYHGTLCMALIKVQRAEINIWIQNISSISLCIVGI